MVDERHPEAEPDHRQTLASAKPCCTAATKLGKPCKARAEADGYCRVHSPSRTFDPVETGRKGGQKSAIARRARRESVLRDNVRARNGTPLDARIRLREAFEADHEHYAKLKAVYEEALDAMTADGRPDHRTRLAAGDSFLAQIYGKPKQTVEAKHEHEVIYVVSRLDEALRRAKADVELPPGDVTEIEAGLENQDIPTRQNEIACSVDERVDLAW
jgi:Family of unknown function (DUF5763)